MSQSQYTSPPLNPFPSTLPLPFTRHLDAEGNRPHKPSQEDRKEEELEDCAGERNAFSNSKVLHWQHAEVWEEGGKVQSVIGGLGGMNGGLGGLNGGVGVNGLGGGAGVNCPQQLQSQAQQNFPFFTAAHCQAQAQSQAHQRRPQLAQDISSISLRSPGKTGLTLDPDTTQPPPPSQSLHNQPAVTALTATGGSGARGEGAGTSASSSPVPPSTTSSGAKRRRPIPVGAASSASSSAPPTADTSTSTASDNNAPTLPATIIQDLQLQLRGT
ncbi:hypothetical protein CVT25_014427 [Psilocybe cyanescens]|uniref:Uncharacterized protein n=1 Tax=Psilocybe cyanescens TaxID=93625 RepID=A0A409WRA6_PSICY|nr:hypothetical protein CVT25_014427 [Psilocybe cyanescens]